MIAPYDYEALWVKAKVFLNRAMDDDGRAFDEQALWASAALELLGKSALARVSPLLIANPSEDGANLLIASGLIQGEARFTSVSASTIFKRCAKAFAPFSSREAQHFADARNEYLHGASIAFVNLPPDAWWPRYWALASTLVTAQDRSLPDLVGHDRVAVVEQHLEQNARNVETQTEALIQRARQRLAQYQSGTLPARVQAQWTNQPDLSAGLEYSCSETCPACGASGTLEGSEYADINYEYVSNGPDFAPDVWATLSVPSETFSCSECHLVLENYALVEQAGLPDSFEIVDEDPQLEPDYGND